MILRTPEVANSQQPAANSRRLTMLAAGIIAPDERQLQAPAYFDASAAVEHRITRVEDRWIAEVRINGALEGKGIFRGTYAQADALDWCRTLAPQARGIEVNTIDDDTWAAMVNEAFDSAPVDEAEFLTPEHVGARDAERGWPCDPTRYFVRLGDCEGYIVAWKEVAAIMLTVPDDDDYGSVEDDTEWIRWGC